MGENCRLIYTGENSQIPKYYYWQFKYNIFIWTLFF